MEIPVDCPLCGADTAIINQEIEPGYELPPVLVDLGFGEVQMYESIAPRIAALNLACGCRIPYPPWILRFERPGIRPYFIKKE
jgi:hypothetical protein